MSKDFLNVSPHTNNRKRKMKDVAAQHPPPPPRFASAPPVAPLCLFPSKSPTGAGGASSSAARPPPLASHFDTALRLSSVESGRQQTASDLAVLSRPIKSFTSLLLTGDGDGDGGNNEAAAAEEGTHRIIKHAVTCYSERVREMMEEMCMQQHAVEHAMAEERAAKKAKEMYDEMMGRVMARNSELERLLSNYRNQAMNMGHRIKVLEQANASLRAALHQATLSLRSGGGGGGETMMLVGQHHQQPQVGEEEDAQSSSSVDPEQSGRPVRLTCRLCSRRIATVMLWPCRHLCLCKRCEGFANRCPVCEAVFQANIEVDLSG